MRSTQIIPKDQVKLVCELVGEKNNEKINIVLRDIQEYRHNELDKFGIPLSLKPY